MNNLLNNRFIAFLKLVRAENLAMIILTMIFLRSFVLQKVFINSGVQQTLNNQLFYLLILSTVLIAAAGYIINDYFDVKTDLINHPDTVVLDRAIKRRTAILLHITLTFIGVMLGMYTALKTGYLRLAIFHVVAATLLWLYSITLKKKLLIGNVVVSLLTASVAFMPFVFELGIILKNNPDFISSKSHLILSAIRITSIFGIFAFMTSMAREILKDIEDYKGDKATGGATMPIVWGITTSKFNAFFLLQITALLLLFVVYNTVRFQKQVITPSNLYIIFCLFVPLIVLGLYTIKASVSKQFKVASLFLKVIMLLGLCYSLIFYYF